MVPRTRARRKGRNRLAAPKCDAGFGPYTVAVAATQLEGGSFQVDVSFNAPVDATKLTAGKIQIDLGAGSTLYADIYAQISPTVVRATFDGPADGEGSLLWSEPPSTDAAQNPPFPPGWAIPYAGA